MKQSFFIALVVFISSAVVAQKQDSSYKIKNIAILIFDNVELLDFAGPFEVLQLAEKNDKKAFNVYTVAINENMVTTQQHLQVKPAYSITNCPRPDILLLPGGDTRESVKNDTLIQWVKKANENTEHTMSVCSGVFFLAKAGILDGKSATTHYLAIDKLIKEYPAITAIKGKRLVDNGKVITTEGVSAGIDGALYLVQKIFGENSANEIAKYMMYNWEPGSLNILINK